MPTRSLSITLAALCACASLRAAGQNQLDGNIALFSVFAALNAGGFDADIDSTNNHPLRKQIREHLEARKLTTAPELKRWREAHKKSSPAAELSQYISFALLVDGPPSFEYRLKPHEMPPDVTNLEGFERLMTRFHAEAQIDELWKRVQPAYDKAIADYHESVVRAIQEANAYLRNPTSGYMGRRFQIYLDLLGPPNQIHRRSYKDDFYIVVTPSLEPQTDYIRNSYLHYLLDPLSFKYSGELEKKRPLIDYAQGAPALEEFYKADFSLLTTTCLVKAVEARLARGAQRNDLVDQALKEGFVLTPSLFETLAAYEKQEQSMRFYYPELIKAIDLKKEARRLDAVQFAEAPAAKKAKVVREEKKVELTGARKTLEEAENLYAEKNYPQAKEQFLKALQETDQKYLHGKAYYGLARISALSNDPETADKLFRKVLELGPDPMVESWTHLYIGRLADIAGEREEAIKEYSAVLAVQGGAMKARQAAQDGIGKSIKREK